MAGDMSLGSVGPYQKLASTGLLGFTLQNATPTIMSWTAPNDGNMHRVYFYGELIVSTAQTGGVISLQITDPGGTPRTRTIFSGGLGLGYNPPNNGIQCVVAPGTLVSVVETTAQSLGAAVLYGELWGS
jgi:hypothetical protein